MGLRRQVNINHIGVWRKVKGGSRWDWGFDLGDFFIVISRIVTIRGVSAKFKLGSGKRRILRFGVGIDRIRSGIATEIVRENTRYKTYRPYRTSVRVAGK